MTDKKIETKQRYELVEVPVETAVVIKDNQTDSLLNDKSVLQEILIKLDKIEKSVC